MKKCPKCKASVSDTAKFCVKCGFNIKKHEEEQAAQEYFCAECGIKFSGGLYCPECGYCVENDLGVDEEPECVEDDYNDNWLGDIESSVDSAVDKKRETDVEFQTQKMLAAFEYESNFDGTYTITGLNATGAMRYVVPEGVVSIKDSTFEGCDAIHITLPESLLNIGNYAFRGCKNLSTINLPASIMIIGDEAFADCELLEIEIPGTVRKVGTDVIKNTAPDIRAKAEKEKEEKRYADACEAEFQRLIVEGFKFGKYHYYENATNAPIDWIPVAHVENKFLFVSKYIICANTFHNSEKCTGWAVSTLRNWLNDSFSTAYFNQEEKSKILLAKELTAMISGADDLSFDDKVFVLSKKELKKFNLGVCYKTPYCATYYSGAEYWTRSVENGNYINYYHSNDCTYYVTTYTNRDKGIRPAIWVELDIE